MDERSKRIFRWFFSLANSKDNNKSAREERERYHHKPPYHTRIVNWINKFYLPNKKKNGKN